METRNGRRQALTVNEKTSPHGEVVAATKGQRIAYKHPTPRRLDWACADHPDPEMFHPTDAIELAEAKNVCDGCPARAACLRLGLDRDEWGVWGGVLLENGKPLDRPRAPGRPKKTPDTRVVAGAA